MNTPRQIIEFIATNYNANEVLVSLKVADTVKNAPKLTFTDYQNHINAFGFMDTPYRPGAGVIFHINGGSKVVFTFN